MALTDKALKDLVKDEATRITRAYWQRPGAVGRLPPITSNSVPVLCFNTDDGAGDNSYKGKIIVDQCKGAADASGDLSMPMGAMITGGIPCVIWDLAKNDRPGHRIPTGSYHVGFVVGIADDGATPLVLISYGRDSVFRVDLTKDGGADGDDNNPPTYTYSATYRDTSIAGTHIELLAQRPNGSFTPATIGIGHDSADGFVLMWCDEIPVTDTCGPAMGEAVGQFYVAEASNPQPAAVRYMVANFH